MESVTINWSKNFISPYIDAESKHVYLDKKGFYAIIGGKVKDNTLTNQKILYIGKAFKQTLRVRIPQEHKKAEKCISKYLKQNPGTTVHVKLGIIYKSSAKTRTQQLYDDIECCLIYTNQPECNILCKESYEGREIQIINNEYPGPTLKQVRQCKPKKT